jgi:hypothetical protein
MQAPSGASEILFDKLQELSPKDDRQRMLQAQALTLLLDLGRMRWLQFTHGTTSVTMPLLVVLVFWLATLFISFKLFAPINATVVARLSVSSLCVSAAILLILELYTPYSGLIQVSNAPLRAALSQLGRRVVFSGRPSGQIRGSRDPSFSLAENITGFAAERDERVFAAPSVKILEHLENC